MKELLRISRFLKVENPLLQFSEKQKNQDNFFILHSLFPECLIRIRIDKKRDNFFPSRSFVLVKANEKHSVVMDVIRNYSEVGDQQLKDVLKFAEKWLIIYFEKF